jgi:hypothetical protein
VHLFLLELAVGNDPSKKRQKQAMLFIKMTIINQEFHLIWIHTLAIKTSQITNQEQGFSERHALISRPDDSIQIHAQWKWEKLYGKKSIIKSSESHSHVSAQTGSSREVYTKIKPLDYFVYMY